MTERGLPGMDSPVACPFVAFVDDRDERSTSPDHRHRCYAEATPAPRALAHQEAYCLASAFPVCPTFQDWARREAARTRSEPAAPPTSAGMPIPGLTDERPSGDEDIDEPVYEDRPRRNSQRDWAAPPPWLNGSDASGAPAADAGDDRGPSAGDAFAGGAAAGAAGAAGAGLSGSFADRLVTPAEPAARQRVPVWRDGDRWDDELHEEPAAHEADAGPAPTPAAGVVAGAAMAGAAAGNAHAGADDPEVEEISPPRRSRDRGQGPLRDRDDTGRHEGPSWERPARLETFPTLRAQRMPSINVPTLVVAAIAVVLVAVLLFFLPGLLGLGSKEPAASPTPTVSVSVAAASLEATLEPAPTQSTYVVQSGDTMSKIAGKFHVPLQTLINANPQIKNPNRLQIGDQVIIPVASASSVPGASAAPSP